MHGAGSGCPASSGRTDEPRAVRVATPTAVAHQAHQGAETNGSGHTPAEVGQDEGLSFGGLLMEVLVLTGILGALQGVPWLLSRPPSAELN
jgi:hypothetical protein